MRSTLSLLLIFCLAASGLGQTPGTVQYPTSQDTTVTLFETTDSAATVLTLSITSSATFANVTSTTKFPSTGSLVIDSEVIYYTGKTGTSFTGLLRGRTGTTAAAHASGVQVRAPVLAAHHNALASALIATEGKLGAGASTPTAGTMLRGTGPGVSTWGALTNSDVTTALNGSTVNGITCVGCTNIGTGTAGGTANTGDTVNASDTDANGSGKLSFQAGGVERAVINPDGSKSGFMPVRELYASEAGAALNSNLTTGGGTDDTMKIQALLNVANTSGKPTRVIIDGPALVGALNVYSNTTIRCTDGGGFYLKNSTNRALLRNAHPAGSGAVTDKHITIEGCTFNGNYANQTGVGTYSRREATGTLIGLVQLYGVDNVRVLNCNFIGSKSIALHFSNATNVWVDGSYIDNNVPTEPQQGGIQFEGPSSKLFVTNTNGNTQDDLVAFSSDGGSYVEGIFTGLGPYVSTGDITDYQVRGLNSFGNSYSAVRLFNSTHRLDRGVIDGVTGTYATACVWNDPAGLTPGNIGTLSISHVNVHMVNYTTVTSFQTGIALYGNIDHLILNDITFNDPEDSRGHLFLDATANVKHLDVNGFRVYDTTDRTSNVMIYVSAGATLQKGDFRNVTWLRGASHARAESLVHIVAGSTVNDLFMDGVYANRVDTIVFREASTTTATMTLRNIRHLAPTSSSNRTVSNTAGTISLLDVSGWYSDTAGRVFNSGTITAKAGDAFVTTGTCTLVAGVCTVTYADTTTNTGVIVNRKTDGGTVGASYSVTRSAGTSFTITSKDGSGSTQAADTSTVFYQVRD
jgi:hypothetical protein